LFDSIIHAMCGHKKILTHMGKCREAADKTTVSTNR
jgi:hypothetical protein